MLSDRYDRAFEFAHGQVRARTRKGAPVPYVAHLMAVSALVLEYGGDEDQAIAALLHDAPKGPQVQSRLTEIETQFGSGVARLVGDIVDPWFDPKPAWRAHREAYLAKLGRASRRAALVALADKTHEAEVILHDYLNVGNGVWNRHSGGEWETRWFYQEVAASFLETLPGHLSQRLNMAVAGFAK